MPKIPIGAWFEAFVNFVDIIFRSQFDNIRLLVNGMVGFFESTFNLLPFWVVITLLALFVYKVAGRGTAIFTIIGLLLIHNIELWSQSLQTLSLVLTSTIITLIIAIPLGILAAKSDVVDKIVRPVLDFMQTMPAFVYLLPAVTFFRIGIVPAVMATIIFAMPPAVRLTNLGIRQVPADLVEAGNSFGSTWYQMLLKIQLPQALPTIMAGINQCIMLSLSMVVIASMIGAGGLGQVVRSGISNFDIGMGFEGGIAVVIIAIILDRLTQSVGIKK